MSPATSAERGQRRAVVVRGGWSGHVPVQATDRFIPFLRRSGFTVDVHDDLDVYADTAAMSGVDLVVQCWSDGSITDDQVAGLSAAVRSGAGLAGWHGGIIDSFRHSREYLHLTGGQFVHHPDGFVDHRLEVVAERRQHPVVSGVTAVELHTEKYWVLTDPLNDVLATVTFDAGRGPGDGDTPWRAQATMPAVWTREWGSGRVFVCTVGHRLEDLDQPQVRTLVERGLLWAARTPGRPSPPNNVGGGG